MGLFQDLLDQIFSVEDLNSKTGNASNGILLALAASSEKIDNYEQLIKEQIESWTIFPSSAIAAMNYDFDSKSVSVRFTTGGSYTYYGVSPTTIEQWQNADSLGQFFLSNIKGIYSFSKN